MKITDRIRKKYPNFTDTEIVEVVSWNKQCRRNRLNNVLRTIALYALRAILSILVTILAASIIRFVINIFF